MLSKGVILIKSVNFLKCRDIKKIIIVIASVLIIFWIFIFLHNQKHSLPSLNKLRKMSGSECIELFEEYGLVLPEEYNDNMELAEKDVEYILDEMQNTSTPSGVIAYDRAGIHELAEQIEDIVGKFSQ